MTLQQRGFTLIEVLAALIIVSLGFLAVIQAVSQTVNNANYLREKTIAHWVAMNKLTEVRVSATPPPGGETSGDIDMAGSAWHWRMNIGTVPNSATLQRIDINVAPKTAGEQASIATVTGIYGRAIASGGGRIEWDINPQLSGSSSSSSSSAGSSSSSSSSAGSSFSSSASSSASSIGP